jgi:hypothetical protein
MRFRKTLTFLIMATALIVAPFAGARQKNFAESSAKLVSSLDACSCLQM